MVLEKQSSILGYPGEISKSMVADHHDVCKFTSQEDPNYISVRNALNTIVNSITETCMAVIQSFVNYDEPS